MLIVFNLAFLDMKGRVDDNIETIRKRFKVFEESSLAVINYYSSKGKVKKVNTKVLFLVILLLITVVCGVMSTDN